MKNKPNDGIVYSTGECAAQKFDPLSKEKLFEMVGKPVYVIGNSETHWYTSGWKVIEKIMIARDSVVIMFTEGTGQMIDLSEIYCFDHEVPDTEIMNEDTLEMAKRILRKRAHYHGE